MGQRPGRGEGFLSGRSQLRLRQAMLMTRRKPATIGEILVEEFMKPIGLTQGALAEAMGVQRKHVNELCNDRRNVTAATALIRPRVRQQPGFLAQCAAAKRPVGSDEFPARAETDRTRAPSDRCGMNPAIRQRAAKAS